MTQRVYEGDQRLTGNIHTQMWLLKKRIAGKITCYMALSKPHIMATVIIKVKIGDISQNIISFVYLPQYFNLS